jgi:hypothetical protein
MHKGLLRGHSEYEEGPSRRARPHVPGRGADLKGSISDYPKRVPHAVERIRGPGRAQKRNRNGRGYGEAPNFYGTTTWAVFRRQFETVEGHNCWTHLEKFVYLITSLQGRATDMLHGVPKGASYEETIEAWEDRFGTSTWPPCIEVS